VRTAVVLELELELSIALRRGTPRKAGLEETFTNRFSLRRPFFARKRILGVARYPSETLEWAAEAAHSVLNRT
jgi:hypothetical protein